MTVALKNVDYQFLDVLKSLLQLRSNIELFQVDDDEIQKKEQTILSEDESLKKMRESSLKTVWESLKNDSW